MIYCTSIANIFKRVFSAFFPVKVDQNLSAKQLDNEARRRNNVAHNLHKTAGEL